MMRGRPRTVLLVVLIAATALGCGKDGDAADDAGSPSAVGPAEEISAAATASRYVGAVNQLCADLAATTMDVTGGGTPTREQFLADQPKLTVLTQKFDADVAKIEVPEADRAAADALRAFQSYSDAEYAKVVAAAESGNDERFAAAFDAFLADFEQSGIPAELAEAGISCPAR